MWFAWSFTALWLAPTFSRLSVYNCVTTTTSPFVPISLLLSFSLPFIVSNAAAPPRAYASAPPPSYSCGLSPPISAIWTTSTHHWRPILQRFCTCSRAVSGSVILADVPHKGLRAAGGRYTVESTDLPWALGALRRRVYSGVAFPRVSVVDYGGLSVGAAPWSSLGPTGPSRLPPPSHLSLFGTLLQVFEVIAYPRVGRFCALRILDLRNLPPPPPPPPHTHTHTFFFFFFLLHLFGETGEICQVTVVFIFVSTCL